MRSRDSGILMPGLVALLVLGALALTDVHGRPARAQAAEIDLSTSLVGLGIAERNLQPNDPTLDARPLVQAALAYAKAHGVQRLTASPGAYYFLTTQRPDRYLEIRDFDGLELDLTGADLHFAQSHRVGLHVANCNGCTLRGFTVDYQQLPFTQVRVRSVDVQNRRLQVEPLPGFDPPSTFNADRTLVGIADTFWGFAFREGQPVMFAHRWAVQRPLADDAITLANGELGYIQPDDTFVVSMRGGRPAIVVEASTGLTLQNVSVYASSLVGIVLNNVRSSTVEGIAVEPRPGTARLVSSNADGIALQQTGEQNRVRQSRIRRSQDDAISASSLALGLLIEQPEPQTVKITHRLPSRPGTPVYFVDPATALTVGSAVVVSQTGSPGGDTVQLDRALTALPPGAIMLDGDPNHRGDGLVIESNTIEDVVLGRGISLWGLVGVSVRGNTIRNTQMAGVDVVQKLSQMDWICGPNERIEIRENVLERANVGFEFITPEMLASILVHALNDQLQAVTAQTNREITIANNRVSSTPRSAIRVENVDGGNIAGNVLEAVATAPEPPRAGPFRAPSIAAGMAVEFAQPIVVKNSSVSMD